MLEIPSDVDFLIVQLDDNYLIIVRNKCCKLTACSITAKSLLFIHTNKLYSMV